MKDDPDLERLRTGLKNAEKSADYRSGPIVGWSALIAVQRYFAVKGLAADEMRLLRELCVALLDSDNGVENKLVAPIKTRGGQKRPVAENQRLVFGAVVITLQVEAGTVLKEAAGKVARAIGHDLTPDRLINFRKELLAQRGDAWGPYEDFLDSMRLIPAKNLKDRAEIALTQLRNLYAQKV